MILASEETIVALATPQGAGAIGVIRLSGSEAISIANEVFSNKDLSKEKGYTLHYGPIADGDIVLDEVVLSLFRGPRSYTGEDTVEISCHGSMYILQRMIELLIRKGARTARAGEFTQRAFMNGKMDLAQAEAVADLIASGSEKAHAAAMQQMRGGFSTDIAHLRERLISFASLIELELDFSEEDVEFADRKELEALLLELHAKLEDLLRSFKLGNVIKNGVPVVIAGKPNAGKSTLLNALFNEEKAIVSNIAGTTRDVIEDELIIDGIGFRFIDTAGLRETEDEIEAIGVERTLAKIQEAALLLFVVDLSEWTEVAPFLEYLKEAESYDIPYLIIANKTDIATDAIKESIQNHPQAISLSALQKDGIEALKERLLKLVHTDQLNPREDSIITNSRHFESLGKAQQALEDVINGLHGGITGDFLAMDIRQALHFLGEITGQITTDDLLDNIFSNFCIGK